MNAKAKVCAAPVVVAPASRSRGTHSVASCRSGPPRQLAARLPAAHAAGKRAPAGRAALTVTARKEGPPVLIPQVPYMDGAVDVMGYLRQNRIIFVGEPITDKACVSIVADLLAMEISGPGEEIKIYLNSPESVPYHIFAIIDVIQQLKCPVSTVAFGMCGGASTLLLAAGTKGRRTAMPHSRILIHQPMGGAMGSSFEVNIQATELSRNMRLICKMYSQFTGMDEDLLREEIDRDNFLSPQKCVEMGIIDFVLD